MISVQITSNVLVELEVGRTLFKSRQRVCAAFENVQKCSCWV